MRNTSPKRSRQGFTLTEVVLVVALLAILAALAIPAVGALRRQLHIAKLDSYARQIFLAAQNELVTMRANGTLPEFESAAGAGGEVLIEAPADYPTGDGDSWKNLYAVPGDNVQGILRRAEDSVNTATDLGGSFLMEVDPVSGSVYSVFYAESGALTYDSVLELADRARSTRSRLERPLGYYSGGVIAATGTLGKLKPVIEIVNGEELYVEVSCDGIPTGLSAALTITVKGESSDETWTSAIPWILTNQPATLVLDSLESGRRFSGRHGSLIPGENLSITAAVTCSDGGKTYSGVSASKRVNSLFGSRDANGDLTVSRVRHLNNLRGSIYQNVLRDPDGTALTITQTAPIRFVFDEWEREARGTLSANPLSGFAPIENDSLLMGSTYVGGRNPISDFAIQGSTGTGLFSKAEAFTLQGVRLEDVSAAGGGPTGALIGTAASCTITDCGVYLTYQENENGATAAQTTMEEWVEDHTVSGASNVGGLVGSMSGGRLENSFAALNVTASGSHAGGLVGSTSNGAAISTCYASGDVKANTYAGGLTGRAQALTVENCYSTSDVSAADHAGGVVGGGSGQVANAKVYGLVAQDGVSNAHPIGSGVSVTDCKYLRQSAYNDRFGTFDQSGSVTPGAYGDFKKTNDPSFSFPYADALNGPPKLNFPFELLGMPHYGDWPEEIIVDGTPMLVYYEKYSNGVYGIYGIEFAEDGAVSVLNTLLGNEFTIAETGYGFLKGADMVMPEWKLDGSGDPFTGPLAQENAIATVNGQGLYLLSDELAQKLDEQKPSAYTNIINYVDFEGISRTLHINTKYAAAIFTEISHNFQFRTADQLQNTSGHSSDWSFRQTHNIDLTNLDETPAGNKDPGMLDNNMGASYDGETNTIRGLKKPLFEKNGGALTNLKLTHVDISREGGAAALALSSDTKQISNCLSHGSVTATSGDAAGLVLDLKGSRITNSYANCTVTAEAGNASGFAGNTGTAIENCYADGHVYASGAAAGFMVGRGPGYTVVRNSYTITDIHGATMYGFAPVDAGVEKATCHWAYNVDHDDKLTYDSSGTADALYTISVMDLGGVWGPGDETTTHPDTLTGAYPYPKLNDLDHWGDWPEMPENQSKFVTIGVVYNPNGGGHDGGAFGDYIEFDPNGQSKVTAFDTTAFGNFQTYRGVYLLTQGSGGFREWNIYRDPERQQIVTLERTPDELLDFATPDGNKYEAWKLIELTEEPADGTTFYLGSADGRYTFQCVVHQGKHQQSIEVTPVN